MSADYLVYCPDCNTIDDWATGSMPFDCPTCGGNGTLHSSQLPPSSKPDYIIGPDNERVIVAGRVDNALAYALGERTLMFVRAYAAELVMLIAVLCVLALLAFGVAR